MEEAQTKVRQNQIYALKRSLCQLGKDTHVALFYVYLTLSEVGHLFLRDDQRHFIFRSLS